MEVSITDLLGTDQILDSTVPRIDFMEQCGFFSRPEDMMIAVSHGAANRTCYAGAFASGDVQWRVPLAM